MEHVNIPENKATRGGYRDVKHEKTYLKHVARTNKTVAHTELGKYREITVRG